MKSSEFQDYLDDLKILIIRLIHTFVKEYHHIDPSKNSEMSISVNQTHNNDITFTVMNTSYRKIKFFLSIHGQKIKNLIDINMYHLLSEEFMKDFEKEYVHLLETEYPKEYIRCKTLNIIDKL